MIFINWPILINNYGSGGMITKLEAANICMNSGCHMFIANGNKNNPIDQMIKKEFIQNLFQKYLLSLQEKMDSKLFKFNWNNIY